MPEATGGGQGGDPGGGQARATESLRDVARRLAPWPVRRFLRSAYEDMRSLPLRLANAERWNDPWNLAHNNGGGDFRARGENTRALLERAAGLTPQDRVLEIGCGQGALPLALNATNTGGYVGFDVSRAAIGYAARRLAGRRDFRFEHVDLFNGDYNAGGRLRADTFRFPVDSGWASLVCAFSVFTHLSATDSAHYLRESGRALGAGGQFAATFYLLDAESRAAIADGRAQRQFVHPALGGWTNNPETPEAGIAHALEAVQDWFAAAGLEIVSIEHGDWRAPVHGLGGQDLIIARK